jgi:prephenate dehydrogenase
MVGRLCIVGLGLIGGGVGLAAKRTGAAARVIGVTARAQTLDKARLMGAIDEGVMDPRVGVADADLIVLAVPGRLQPEVARNLLPACRAGAILTDAASTKTEHVALLEKAIAEVNPKVRFIGSHPIAGSEKNGIEAAPLLKLDGAWCILTPRPGGDEEAYRTVETFWRALGMRIKRMTPEDHDEVLARSSHLPHILSSTLVGLQTAQSLELSGSGLADTTRLAGGSPEIWTDICVRNWRPLSRTLRETAEELRRFAEALDSLGKTGAPEAEAARERVFRRLADAKQRYDEYRAKRPAEIRPDNENE